MPSRNEFGRYSNLREVEIDISTNNHLEPKTRTMQISLNSWKLLQNHSKNFHSLDEQPVSYDTCIEELCTFWNSEHNQKYIHFDRN